MREQVVAARQLMGAPSFLSLQEAARVLGIFPSSRLDQALWHFIGVDSEDLTLKPIRPEPMF